MGGQEFAGAPSTGQAPSTPAPSGHIWQGLLPSAPQPVRMAPGAGTGHSGLPPAAWPTFPTVVLVPPRGMRPSSCCWPSGLHSHSQVQTWDLVFCHLSEPPFCLCKTDCRWSEGGKPAHPRNPASPLPVTRLLAGQQRGCSVTPALEAGSQVHVPGVDLGPDSCTQVPTLRLRSPHIYAVFTEVPRGSGFLRKEKLGEGWGMWAGAGRTRLQGTGPAWLLLPLYSAVVSKSP